MDQVPRKGRGGHVCVAPRDGGGAREAHASVCVCVCVCVCGVCVCVYFGNVLIE